MDTATGPTTLYIYRDLLGQPLYVGITSRGLRRQHEFAESKIWWPLVVTCQLSHCSSFEEAVSLETEIKDQLHPPFNTDDKRMALAKYYNCDPVVELASAAEVRRRRLRWRDVPRTARVSIKCVQCEDRMSLELLDGDCALCHLALKDAKSPRKRLDGKRWGGSTAGVK